MSTAQANDEQIDSPFILSLDHCRCSLRSCESGQNAEYSNPRMNSQSIARPPRGDAFLVRVTERYGTTQNWREPTLTCTVTGTSDLHPWGANKPTVRRFAKGRSSRAARACAL